MGDEKTLFGMKLEKRLRARTRQVFQVLDAATGECRVTNEPDPDCAEAADAIADLTRKMEALTRERDALREGFKISSDRVERLAFQMPPPNDWTPQFVGLAQSMRLYADEQHRLSTGSAAKDDATGPADAG